MDNLKIGYNNLYGTIVNFLYNDIKKIKWMIYDIIYNDNTIPTIIYITEKIQINKINDNINFEKSEEYINSLNLWNNLNDNEIINFKSLILFYINFKKPELNEKINRCIKKNFHNIEEIENNDGDDVYEYNGEDINNINDIECLKLIKSKIYFKYLYEYIFDCVQQFKYTWYGNRCMSSMHHLYNVSDYFENNYNLIEEFNQIKINESNKKKYYITLKIYYNYFKSLINYNSDKLYKQYSKSFDWDELTLDAKNKIIMKLNDNRFWFSIKKNIKNLYNDVDIDSYMITINNILYSKYSSIKRIIIETLVINGILTKFVYNPINTDNNILPDKNKESEKWEKHLKDNLFTHDITNDYDKSYNFLNNKRLDNQKLVKNRNGIEYSCIDTMKNSIWYKGFGGDWICQIQQFHHFIHNRVILVTGATGAGKSTIFPFIMLYAYKIINYNNNAKIICTAPRKKPVIENSSRIAGSLGVSIIENGVNEIQYYTSTDQQTNDIKYHPTLRFVTDGSVNLSNHYILKKNYDEGENINDTDENFFDMLLVDESHENNTYITFLLTLIKFAVYINNSVSLGIVSATMEYDELIYRTYYKSIDDNYKYPLNLYNKEHNINRNLLDRRVHLSKPFYNTNFKIEEIPYKKNKTKIEILQTILRSSTDGDILIFEPGSGDVKKTVNEINNSSFCPNNVIAVPYYSEMHDKLKKIVDVIDKQNIRNNYRFPKKYNIGNYNPIDLENSEFKLVPEGTYTRFIIVGTNIVEASVTIDSLVYVIDTGKHKKNIFDIRTHKSNLQEKYIAIQNRIQRRGRVGRTKPGFFYQTYDIEQLSKIGDYLICTSNIINDIINLITEKKNKTFDKDNDPYLIDDIEKLSLSIKKQYIYNDYKNDNESVDKIFDYEKIYIEKIIYPYSDGKYDYLQLVDEKGEFYIIHPNELDFVRDDNYNIIKKKLNYNNKTKDIFEYLQTFKIFNKENIITDIGSNIFKILKIFITKNTENKNTIEINDLFYFLHCLAFEKYNIKLFNYLVHNGIIKWIFSNNRIDIKLDKYVVTKCDFIAKSKTIPKQYYEMAELNYNYQKKYDKNIKKNKMDENGNIIKDFTFDENIEKNKIDTIILNLTNEKLKKENLSNEKRGLYLTILRDYNILKIKLQYIFENIKNYNLSSLSFNTSMYNIDKELIFSYLLVNYYSENLIEKIKGVDLYQNFYDKDINNLYEIKKITYIDGKTKLLTNITEEYRQFILYLSIEDDHSVQELLYVSPTIFRYLNKTVIVKCNKLLKTNIDLDIIGDNNLSNDLSNKKNKNNSIMNEEYLIEKINPNFKKYLYDIINNNL